MTVTFISTNPETDYCPRCGEQLATLPKTDAGLTEAAAVLLNIVRAIAGLSDDFVEDADNLNLLSEIFLSLRDQCRAAIAKAEGRTP